MADNAPLFSNCLLHLFLHKGNDLGFGYLDSFVGKKRPSFYSFIAFFWKPFDTFYIFAAIPTSMN